MTHTATQVKPNRRGAGFTTGIYDIDITSYTSAGEVPTAANYGMGSIDMMLLNPVSDNGHVWRFDGTKIRAYKLGAGGGIVTESFPDVKGGIAANVTSDSASAATGDAFVMALADANATTSGNLAHASGKSTGLTNPNTAASAAGNAASGRNVVVAQKADAGGTTFTAANVIVTGTDQFGNAQTETIALQTGAVAASNWRDTVGTKVFATVTNVRLTAAQPSGSTISVGIGTVFGLRGKITAESDIQSVRKDSADVASTTYVGSATTHSLDMGADVADDVDIVIQYDAVASSLVDREAAATTDVGMCRAVVIGVGL